MIPKILDNPTEISTKELDFVLKIHRDHLEDILKTEQQLSIIEKIAGKEYILWFQKTINLTTGNYVWYYRGGAPYTQIPFCGMTVEKYQVIASSLHIKLNSLLEEYNKTQLGNKILF